MADIRIKMNDGGKDLDITYDGSTRNVTYNGQNMGVMNKDTLAFLNRRVREASQNTVQFDENNPERGFDIIDEEPQVHEISGFTRQPSIKKRRLPSFLDKIRDGFHKDNDFDDFEM